ncbi:hypothetical protein BGW36DRAFT_66933 [Talaromyces proteolyticus]|uniref:Uncharacterized protein n=1 Tax=Talaromyces proteolyticus TaxID=1131652 RepID=A0AAD4KJQ9_9EURO|nr:uncharacterized protein BGW36DRAFT_66933 [Talaromyces proteolyticus]KAH8690076.1 hypothetical protein BGW36DRAFT_66933 [Talaromyces proteolyticus]
MASAARGLVRSEIVGSWRNTLCWPVAIAKVEHPCELDATVEMSSILHDPDGIDLQWDIPSVCVVCNTVALDRQDCRLKIDVSALIVFTKEILLVKENRRCSD